MRITYGRVGFELNANLLDSHSMRYSIRIRVDRPLGKFICCFICCSPTKGLEI